MNKVDEKQIRNIEDDEMSNEEKEEIDEEEEKINNQVKKQVKNQVKKQVKKKVKKQVKAEEEEEVEKKTDQDIEEKEVEKEVEQEVEQEVEKEVEEKEKKVKTKKPKVKYEKKEELELPEDLKHITSEFLSNKNSDIKVKLGIYNNKEETNFSREISKLAYHYFLEFFTNKENVIHEFIYYNIKKYNNDVLSIETGNNSSCISKKHIIESKDFKDDHMLLSLEEESYTYNDIPDCNDKPDFSYSCVKNTFKLGDYQVNLYHNIVEKTRNVRKNIVPIYEINFIVDRKSIEKDNSLLYKLIENFKNMYYNFRREFQDYFIEFNNLVIKNLSNSLSNEIVKKYDFNDNIYHQLKREHALNDKITECFFDIEEPKNIKLEDIPFLSDYLFFPKPLGELYFLFINEDSEFFYINNRNIIKLEKTNILKNEETALKNTIIVGYLSGDFKISIKEDLIKQKDESTMFMMYDILIYNDEDKTGDALKQRHELLGSISDVFNKDKVFLLNYYEEKLNTEKPLTVSQIIHKILKKCSEMGQNNGIIMKHNDHYNNLINKERFKFPILKYNNFTDIRIKVATSISDDIIPYENCASYYMYSQGINGLQRFSGTDKFILLEDTINMNIKEFKFINKNTIVEVSWNGSKFIVNKICNEDIIPISTNEIETLWNEILYTQFSDEMFVEYSKNQVRLIENYENTNQDSINENIEILLYYVLLTGNNTSSINNINRVIKDEGIANIAKNQLLSSVYKYQKS
jgi:hypothetical protein